jgi:hypothetical protein
MNKKQTESWLPKTESDVLKDTWNENLKRSVTGAEYSTPQQLTEAIIMLLNENGTSGQMRGNKGSIDIPRGLQKQIRAWWRILAATSWWGDDDATKQTYDEFGGSGYRNKEVPKKESTQLSTDAQLTEQDVTRPRMPRNAPTFRPDLRNPDFGLQFDHNREARERFFDFLTHIFRVLAMMKIT